MSKPAGSDGGVSALKRALKTLWELENELRFSAWDALPFDKDKALGFVQQLVQISPGFRQMVSNPKRLRVWRPAGRDKKAP